MVEFGMTRTKRGLKALGVSRVDECEKERDSEETENVGENDRSGEGEQKSDSDSVILVRGEVQTVQVVQDPVDSVQSPTNLAPLLPPDIEYCRDKLNRFDSRTLTFY